jgi:hypothetical protein
MFEAGTKDCNTVFGQKRTSRADSELNAEATAAVTMATNTPIAVARRVRIQRRDIDLTRIRLQSAIYFCLH